MANAVPGSLESFIDVLPWPAAVVADSGQVTHLNPAMEAQGLRLARHQPRHLRSLFPVYSAALQSDPPWLTPAQVDVERQSASGPVHERVYVFRHGLQNGIVVCDETRLHELETGYAQNSRLASLGFLLASVAHEVNNPLAAISSMVQIIQSKRGVSSEIREKGTNLIAENTRRLLLITRKLTSFARVDDTVRTRFSMDTAIDEAFLQLRYDSMGETVEFEHQREPKAIVLGYQDQAQQVFFNLFLNAAQALKGRGTISVITECATPAEVTVNVSDTGPGIPEADLTRIFEPFFTTKPSGDGIGLGLAICNEIVQEHGGSIMAKRNAIGGALFRLKFPLAPDAGRAKR
ncbi:MAG: ATP-binding protein [Betaproteobacteria bacterium]